MIKFYRGNWADLSGIAQSEDLKIKNNSICFIQDRKVLMMGGDEYGKDVGGFRLASDLTQKPGLTYEASANVAAGTLSAFAGDQSVYRYNGGESWTRIFDPTLSSAEFVSTVSGGTGTEMTFTQKAYASGDMYQATAKDVVDAVTGLESKVSGAYNAGTELSAANLTAGVTNVVVSKAGGIQKTEFILNQSKTLLDVVTNDGGTGTRNGEATLSTRLVTYETLAAQTDDILANGLEIRKKSADETEAGYRATYGLYNKQTGAQLGANINIIKDQFLKEAAYVKGVTYSGKVYEYNPTSQKYIWIDTANSANNVELPSTQVPTDLDGADRYLKLVFAVQANGQTPNDFPADSADYTAADTDNIVYINVNELFDSYVGVSGVTIDQTTNEISAQINASSNESGTGTGTHFDGAFLKNSANGLYVEGIKQEITGYIQDLTKVGVSGGTGVVQAVDQVSALVGNGKFLTMVGVDANGVLTGQCASAFAKDVNFEAINGTARLTSGSTINVAGVTVQDAISSVALHIGSLDSSFDGSATAEHDTQFVYAWTQEDGLLKTSAMAIDASNLMADSFQTAALSAAAANTANIHTVKVDPIYIGNKTGTAQIHLQDALTSLATSVHDTISAMDLALVGKIARDANNGGTANLYGPESDNATTTSNTEAYRIVNTVKQSDGIVYANDIEFSTPYIYFSGIAATDTYESTKTHNNGTAYKNLGGATARIAVSGMSVDKALNGISNYIANLDLNWTASGTVVSANTAPAAISATSNYKVINAIEQHNGQLDATTLDLTAGNTRIAGLTGNIPGYGKASTLTGVAASEARIAILPSGASTAPSALGGDGFDGTVQKAFDFISNVLADYLSFHDKSGNVI